MSEKGPFKYYITSLGIIKLVVMYYVFFTFSLRQVADTLHERGIDICHAEIRNW